MQLNVMPWLTLAWSVALAGRLQWRGALLGLAAVSAVSLTYNVWIRASQRGVDGRQQDILATLERVSDPARTVFVYSGFESAVSWQFMLWSRRWEGVCDLGPAPQASPKLKWISVFSSSIHHPDWTPTQHAEAIGREFDCALAKGYSLIAGPIWDASAEQLADLMVTIGDRKTATLLHEVMRKTFDAKPVVELDGSASYSILTPRPK
jgi:hypothetical protein